MKHLLKLLSFISVLALSGFFVPLTYGAGLPVSVDNSYATRTGSGCNSTSFTIGNHPDRVLMVVFKVVNGAMTSVKYNGVDLTLYGQVNNWNNGNEPNGIWVMKNPPIGSANLQWCGGGWNHLVVAGSFYNANDVVLDGNSTFDNPPTNPSVLALSTLGGNALGLGLWSYSNDCSIDRPMVFASGQTNVNWVRGNGRWIWLTKRSTTGNFSWFISDGSCSGISGNRLLNMQVTASDPSLTQHFLVLPAVGSITASLSTATIGIFGDMSPVAMIIIGLMLGLGLLVWIISRFKSIGKVEPNEHSGIDWADHINTTGRDVTGRKHHEGDID